MAKWILPFLFSLSPLTVAANDEWDTTDSALLAANIVAYTLDARLTMMARRARLPNGTAKYVEKNNLLGEQPDDQRIRNYFMSAAAIHVGVAYLLPQRYRTLFQVGALTVSFAAIGRNYDIGIRLNF